MTILTARVLCKYHLYDNIDKSSLLELPVKASVSSLCSTVQLRSRLRTQQLTPEAKMTQPAARQADPRTSQTSWVSPSEIRKNRTPATRRVRPPVARTRYKRRSIMWCRYSTYTTLCTRRVRTSVASSRYQWSSITHLVQALHP